MAQENHLRELMLLTCSKLILQVNISLILLPVALNVHLGIPIDYKGIGMNMVRNDAIRQEFVTKGRVG